MFVEIFWRSNWVKGIVKHSSGIPLPIQYMMLLGIFSSHFVQLFEAVLVSGFQSCEFCECFA
ncbi:MAG TPA: hypothetical protein DCZ12_06995 [Gammaproteobacteria bacterium]|nr:hypothetical protein [Gammaproteobacteria bacterium]